MVNFPRFRARTLEFGPSLNLFVPQRLPTLFVLSLQVYMFRNHVFPEENDAKLDERVCT